MSEKKAVALTIAGSDSGAGAGIQADLKTFSALGVFGKTVITSITSQNTFGVQAVDDLPIEVVESQLKSIFEDDNCQAVKTGMLGNEEIGDKRQPEGGNKTVYGIRAGSTEPGYQTGQFPMGDGPLNAEDSDGAHRRRDGYADDETL